MSSLIRGEIFNWIIGSIELSNSILVNWAITSILGTFLYVVTFRMVGKLYRSGIIYGSFMGKVCYFILFVINIFLTALILRFIKCLIWMYNYITGVPTWGVLLSIGMVSLIVVWILFKSKYRTNRIKVLEIKK